MGGICFFVSYHALYLLSTVIGGNLGSSSVLSNYNNRRPRNAPVPLVHYDIATHAAQRYRAGYGCINFASGSDHLEKAL
ncbi:hypothetical protein F4859DRAFT_480080 [Xylaria cf. heliscus]|nr:hypothetical protein F4859DRAFT_480080 [Xylaria cf. heliscus]